MLKMYTYNGKPTIDFDEAYFIYAPDREAAMEFAIHLLTDNTFKDESMIEDIHAGCYPKGFWRWDEFNSTYEHELESEILVMASIISAGKEQ